METILIDVIKEKVDLTGKELEILTDYFQTTDELLITRLNIYAFLIISMMIGLGMLIWSLVHFFQRKKNSLQFS